MVVSLGLGSCQRALCRWEGVSGWFLVFLLSSSFVVAVGGYGVARQLSGGCQTVAITGESILMRVYCICIHVCVCVCAYF